MQEQIDRCARAAAGAGFVVIWTTLGFEAAVLAAVGAIAAAELPRLRRLLAARQPKPRTRRVREPLPLVPDEPSLILTVSEL